uniref:Uncharacterized protein n=1 Tax=viral metagenome TaxID=1070528 RepID=A0A6M3LVK9_9ZZZZ
MKKLTLLLVICICCLGCEDNVPLKYDYFGYHSVDYTKVAVENYTCECGWKGLAENQLGSGYLCPNCGRQYEIIEVGDLRVIKEIVP